MSLWPGILELSCLAFRWPLYLISGVAFYISSGGPEACEIVARVHPESAGAL